MTYLGGCARIAEPQQLRRVRCICHDSDLLWKRIRMLNCIVTYDIFYTSDTCYLLVWDTGVLHCNLCSVIRNCSEIIRFIQLKEEARLTKDDGHTLIYLPLPGSRVITKTRNIILSPVFQRVGIPHNPLVKGSIVRDLECEESGIATLYSSSQSNEVQ